MVSQPLAQKMSLCAIGMPVSGAALAARDARVGGARLREALVRVDGDEGVERAVGRAMRSRKMLRQLDAGDLLRGQRGGEL